MAVRSAWSPSPRLALLCLCLCLASTRALPAAAVPGPAPGAAPAPGEHREARGMGHSRNSIQAGDDLMDAIYNDCLRKNSVSCVKYKLFSFVDKVLSSKDSFALTEGVTVVKTAEAGVGGGAPRALDEAVAAGESVEGALLNRVERFLNTHTLKIDLSGKDLLGSVTSVGRALGDVADGLGLSEEEDDAADAAEGDEARGKKKKASKILMPLLMALKLKMAALIPLALGAIALIAGKALLIGKIALLLAAIIGLKKLLSQQKTVTYEIVAHPHHSSSHGGGHDAYSAIGGGGGLGGDIGGGGGGYGSSGSGGHGGWGRALDAQQLAYRGYPQAQPQQ